MVKVKMSINIDPKKFPPKPKSNNTGLDRDVYCPSSPVAEPPQGFKNFIHRLLKRIKSELL